MEAIQPSVGGPPAQGHPKQSFAEALLSTTASNPNSLLRANPTDRGTPGTHKGFPSIAFTDAHTFQLSQSFTWALVAKFSHGYNKKDPKLGRPSVDDLHKFFLTLDFKGSFQIGLLDNRHLLIQFQCEEDYLRMYSRQVWYLRSVSMRIFKWSPYFRVDKESSVAPIWISFPRLPVHLFEKNALFSIARLIGDPLRLDEATAKLKRPSVARVQLELDVLKERPPKLWIQMGTRDDFWQKIDYENVPPYCCHCWHLGHQETQCRVQHPDLRPVITVTKESVNDPKPQLQYKPVYGPTIQHPQQPQSIQQQQPQSSGLTESQKASVPIDISVSQPLGNSTSIRMDAIPSVLAPTPSVIQSTVEVQMVDEGNIDELVAVVDAENIDATDKTNAALVAMSEDQPAVEATAIEPLCVDGKPSSVTYATILQGSAEKEISVEERQQLALSTHSTFQNTPVPELIAQPATPMIENIEGMSSDDDVSQYPFLLPEMITDDTVLYRRKLQEVVAKAWSDSTKVLIEKPRAEMLTEFREFSARMRSEAVEDFAQKPMSQDIIPIDDPEDTLTEINVEDGDFADGFITVKPKNRGRGRPRKHKK